LSPQSDSAGPNVTLSLSDQSRRADREAPNREVPAPIKPMLNRLHVDLWVEDWGSSRDRRHAWFGARRQSVPVAGSPLSLRPISLRPISLRPSLLSR